MLDQMNESLSPAPRVRRVHLVRYCLVLALVALGIGLTAWSVLPRTADATGVTAPVGRSSDPVRLQSTPVPGGGVPGIVGTPAATPVPFPLSTPGARVPTPPATAAQAATKSSKGGSGLAVAYWVVLVLMLGAIGYVVYRSLQASRR
jgi:hypothetical protein